MLPICVIIQLLEPLQQSRLLRGALIGIYVWWPLPNLIVMADINVKFRGNILENLL